MTIEFEPPSLGIKLRNTSGRLLREEGYAIFQDETGNVTSHIVGGILSDVYQAALEHDFQNPTHIITIRKGNYLRDQLFDDELRQGLQEHIKRSGGTERMVDRMARRILRSLKNPQDPNQQ